jgi:hypothetical protein
MSKTRNTCRYVGLDKQVESMVMPIKSKVLKLRRQVMIINIMLSYVSGKHVNVESGDSVGDCECNDFP